MGFANNVVPEFIARDPVMMHSLLDYMYGRQVQEAESSTRLDGDTYVVDERPFGWMFDIDGTLTEWNSGEDPGQRGWYDFHRAGEDLENPATVELALLLKRAETPLIFITARPERFADVTLTWLDQRGLLPASPSADIPLFMRPNDDPDTPDQVVKRALYRSLIQPNWAIHGVFEDNERCISIWLEEGLPTFQPHYRKAGK